MIVSAVSATSVAISIILVAWQSREVARQTRINVQSAVGTSADTAMSLLQAVQLRLLDYPHLYPFLFEGRTNPLPPPELLVLADALADAVNYGCEVAAGMPIAAHRMSGFRDYGSFLMKTSPLIRGNVSDHPEWYPELHEILQHTSGRYER